MNYEIITEEEFQEAAEELWASYDLRSTPGVWEAFLEEANNAILDVAAEKALERIRHRSDQALQRIQRKHEI